MPGLVPGIHVFLCHKQGVDGRDKPGHDAERRPAATKLVITPIASWSENEDQMRGLFEENRASAVLIDEPKFGTSIRQDFEAVGEIFYFRAHGRNAKAWWNPKESWERYDYCYSRDEIKKMADRIKAATSTPGTKKAFAFFNNHARAEYSSECYHVISRIRVATERDTA